MPAISLPRPSYPEAARNLLRSTILDAVDELVRRDGWVATTVARVAGVAGVSRQTVYNEFGSRRNIAETYILRSLDELLARVLESLRTAPDLESGLRASFRHFFDLVDEPLLHTVLDGTTGPDLVELVTDLNRHATERLLIAINELRPDLDEADAIGVADSMARLATAHAVVPTVEPEVAIDRLVRVTSVVLQHM